MFITTMNMTIHPYFICILSSKMSANSNTTLLREAIPDSLRVGVYDNT